MTRRDRIILSAATSFLLVLIYGAATGDINPWVVMLIAAVSAAIVSLTGGPR